MNRRLIGLLSCCLVINAIGCGGGNTTSVNEGYSKSAPADPKTKGPEGAGPTGNAGAAAEPPPAPVP